MAAVNQDQQPLNLASRLDWPNPVSLDDMKGIFASQNVDLDARDELHGWSPLMIACAQDKKEMVQLLLDHGADPNAKGSKDGNTPMHCASVGYNCKNIPRLGSDHCHGWDEQSRKEILRLLINHGATLICNSNGLDPPCIAAIYNFQDIVEFFVQGKTHELQLSNAEKARVHEILGVALGLYTNLNAPACTGESHPCTHFCRALSIHEESGITPYGNHGKSDAAASFSLFSETKECRTREEWENIKSDHWSLKNQCFLVAERVLPEEIKDDYILQRVLKHGLDGVIFQKERNQETLAQGSQICRESIQLELESRFELGSVLVTIVNGIHYKKLEDDVVDECYKLLDLCLQVFNKYSQDRLHEMNSHLVNKVGNILFDIALYDFAKSKNTFESLLQYGERMVRVIRIQIGDKSCASITHCILERIHELNWRSSKDRGKKEECRRKQVKENRMKRLISRMVRCEDATQIDSNGNSMLHSLLGDVQYAKQQFTKETALILIHNGCDIEARNADGLTVKEMICKSSHFDPDAPENEELMTLLSPPRTALPLQEIAARIILRCKIPHEGIVPRHLSVLVTGEVEYSDSELFLEYPFSDCESSSSEYGEWDNSSPDGSESDGVMSD
eukprot:XP_011679221.1 PREDICTED: uncharacterized protein LOC100891428 [Strongylocentrotus purpuratus]